MTPIFLAPGPTKVHPEMISWLQEAEIDGVFSKSHRSTWFEGMFQEIKDGLRILLDIPDTHTIAFSTSATEIWERAIESCVEKESFHLVGGEFSTRWYQFSQRLGRTPSRADYGVAFDGRFDEFEIPSTAEMICLTQSETSIGMWIPDEQIDAISAAHPDKLIALDVVSAIPLSRFDFSRVDIAFFSVQKGFCLPAGLGIVVLSPKAVERAQELRGRLTTTGAYHSLDALAASADKNQTVETPNVLGIYLVKRVLEKYLGIGGATLRADVRARMDRLISLVEEETPFVRLTKVDEYLSPSVLAITGDAPVEDFRKMLIKEHQVYLAGCYSEHKPNGLRIANFPIHTDADHDRAVELLKMI